MAKAPAGEKPNGKLERHPLSLEFSLPMSDEERVALGKDISKNGQHQEIILYQGKVLDGWERYIACLQQGVTPKFKTYEGYDPAAVAFGTNAHRRKMTSVQKALLGARYLIHAQSNGQQVTQRDVATACQCSLTRVNEIVQLLRSTDKECKRAAAELSANPDITGKQLDQLLIDCGINKPAAPPVKPAAAPSTSPDDDDDDDDTYDIVNDNDIDAALGDDIDVDDDDDDDDMPAAKGAGKGGEVIRLLDKGGKRIGHNHRSNETPASRVAGLFKGLTEAERIDFVKFSWSLLRPTLERAMEQGRIEWPNRPDSHMDAGKAATADMARALAGGDIDAALAAAAADGQAEAVIARAKAGAAGSKAKPAKPRSKAA